MARKDTRVRGMNSKRTFPVRGALAIAFLWGSAIACPPVARASLGSDAASVQADQAKMQGALRISGGAAFAVRQIQTASGVAVSEYVSPAGQVFAVTWQGPFHPDLRQLLGAYFDQYSQAMESQRAARHGHGPILIQQGGLVIQVGGHPRSVRGKVYVPQMLPAGARAEDIQ